MVKVSVIMPSLNVTDYIEECMDSVLKQDLRELEIICIDGGSTDGTREKLNKYAEEDKRIIVIDSPVKSYGYQVNYGISIASGEYISIVETDDYISKSMLSFLYNLAKEYDVDVSKADYYGFFLDGHDKAFYGHHLFGGDKQKLYYNKFYNTDVSCYLHLYDTNIWGAIYKKEFLNKYKIMLNETSGAAYQDIGFMQQVHMFAESIIFSDKMLYFYRTDRIESSTNNSVWLKNLYQEYKFLFHGDLTKSEKWKSHNSYIANRIAHAYITELEHSFKNGKFKLDDVPWLEYYYKLKLVIREFIEMHYVSEMFFPKNDWYLLLLSLYSLKSFRDYVKVKEDDSIQKKEALIQVCQGRKCVIFGSGFRGKKALRFLMDNNADVIGFWDNDKLKWGTKYKGILIDEPVRTYYNDDALIVIAVNGGKWEIVKQLKKMKINQERIKFYN